MNASDGTNSNENNPNPSRLNNQLKGKGRQKISIEKIENKTNLQVTFSKRCAGLFKKANELNTLCGAESALMVFTPGGKAHSYGHPSAETIANRFLNTNTNTEPAPLINPWLANHHEESNHQLNQELIHKEELLENERRRKKELDRMIQPRIKDMDYEHLIQLQKSLLEFKSALQSRLEDATSSKGNVQGPNSEHLGGPSVGFTTPSEFNMTSYPNVGGMTNYTGSLVSSYPVAFDPNTGYMIQYSYGAGSSTHGVGGSGSSRGAYGSNVLIPYNFSNPGGEAQFGDTTATTSNMEAEDETRANVSNKSRSQGSRRNNGRGGCS